MLNLISKNKINILSYKSLISKPFYFSPIFKNSFTTTTTRSNNNPKQININFIGKRNELIKTDAYIGESLLDVSQRNGLDVEGVCEGSMACSTCHMIFDLELYNKLPKITEEELDTLDLAPVLLNYFYF